jgi:OmcA/MtrC family decaheme c-type cytochrome
MVTLALFAAIVLAGTPKTTKIQPAPNQKAAYVDPAVVEFVRPGLTITVQSASVANSGTITVNYTLTDSDGVPLDAAGVDTPGVVSLNYIAAAIPQGQQQYVAYTTKSATGAVSGTVTQASSENNGTTTSLGNGQYSYVFKTLAPTGFDPTITTTVAVYGSRNLTAFNLGTNYASTTFNFVPNGAPVTVTRDLIETSTCNKCHDQLSYHGGSRRGINMCVLCHTPQTIDPNTGNTLDLKVMAHKIHMGSELPSVIAGTPYQIIGYMNSVHDFSTVVFPPDPRRCQVCHDQTTGAAQATAYETTPTMAACGSCHDNVNFATGANHPGGAQANDSQCATCHIPQGLIDFDASVVGAHVYPQDSSLLSGITATIQSVTNTNAGEAPEVAFTIQDGSGNGIALSALTNVGLTMAGPTTDYGYTSFGSGVTTPGYVTENPTKTAVCAPSGACTYTFVHSIPAAATGSYSIGIEATRTETVLAGTPTQQSIEYGATNQVVNFSVDGSPVAARRTVVSLTNCNQCHYQLSLHGQNRNQIQMCVLCHNPSNTDAAERAVAQVASDKAAPPQGINFNLLVHRIHTGVNLAQFNRTYIVVGYMGSHNDFDGVRYPAFSPTGDPGDTENCSMCHVNGSEQNLPTGLNPTVDPQGPINPDPAVTAACTGCHADTSTAAHAVSNTTSLGESCEVCHGSTGAYSVASVHAQY